MTAAIRFVCHDFLEGKCTKSPCPHEHSDVTGKPCEKGDACELLHHKRKWLKNKKLDKKCSVCGKLFNFLLPFRRKHHCRAIMPPRSKSEKTCSVGGGLVCLGCLNRDYFPFPACKPCCAILDAELKQQTEALRASGASQAQLEKIEQQQKEQREQYAAAEHTIFESDSDLDAEEQPGPVVEAERRRQREETAKRRNKLTAKLYNLRDLLFGDSNTLTKQGSKTFSNNNNNNSNTFSASAAAAAAMPDEEAIELLFRPASPLAMNIAGNGSAPSALASASSAASASAAATALPVPTRHEDDQIKVLFRPLIEHFESNDNNNCKFSSSPNSNLYNTHFNSSVDDDDDNAHLSPQWERAKRKLRCLSPVLRWIPTSQKRRSAAEIEAMAQERVDHEERDEIHDLFRGGTFANRDVAKLELQRQQREMNENLFMNVSSSRLPLLSYQSPAAIEEREETARRRAEEREQQMAEFERLKKEIKEMDAAANSDNDTQALSRASSSLRAGGNRASFRRERAMSAPPGGGPLAHTSAAVAAAAPVDTTLLTELKELHQQQRKRGASVNDKVVKDERQLKAMEQLEKLKRESAVMRLLRKFGLELTIVAVMLVAMSLGAVSLLRFTQGKFTLYAQCHSCFDDGGLAYNQDTKQCIFAHNITVNVTTTSAAPSPYSSSPTPLPPATTAASASTTTAPTTRTTFVSSANNVSVVAVPPDVTAASAFTSATTSSAWTPNKWAVAGSYSSTARLVVERHFCGAPHCREKESVPGLTSIPYSVMLVGSIVGVFVTASINFIKKLVFLPLKEAIFGYVDPTRTLSKEARSLHLRLSIFGAFDSAWFCFLYLANMSNLGLIIWSVTSTTTRHDVFLNHTTGALVMVIEDLHAGSMWRLYDRIYIRFLNAGSSVQVLLVFFCQLLNATVGAAFINKCEASKADRVLLGDGESSILAKLLIPMASLFGERRALLMHWFVLPLPLVPIMLTHTVTGALIFLPVSVLVLGTYAVFGYIFNKKMCRERKWSKLGQIMWLLLFRIVGNLVVLIFFQTMTAYAELIYRTEGGLWGGAWGWKQVIAEEFSRRDTLCWAVRQANSIHSANVGLASLLLN